MQTISLILVVFAIMFIVERCWPANQLPKVKRWWPRVVLTNIAQAGIVLLAGQTWDRWMMQTEWQFPWALERHFGLGTQIFIAYVILTFIYYWWHRLRHDSRFFWRLCHQLHHSPKRMEILMSFYKHPLEITLNGLLSSIILFPLLGCSPKAAALVTLATGIAELFYHWNIKTPFWLGPIFQRPESHRIHHMRNHHTNNYSDIPLWDMLFGTYQNPKKPVALCGFDSKREDRFDEMLGFRDVHAEGSDQLAPMHLLPTCIGCSKRWACHQSRINNKDL
jgi:sterol desaturase/sphingolipid hydroxylase (fatty acid hydroxylase superfamily)